eukprot:4882135-Pleurochrysis_carterae.AAC.1
MGPSHPAAPCSTMRVSLPVVGGAFLLGFTLGRLHDHAASLLLQGDWHSGGQGDGRGDSHGHGQRQHALRLQALEERLSMLEKEKAGAGASWGHPAKGGGHTEGPARGLEKEKGGTGSDAGRAAKGGGGHSDGAGKGKTVTNEADPAREKGDTGNAAKKAFKKLLKRGQQHEKSNSSPKEDEQSASSKCNGNLK